MKIGDVRRLALEGAVRADSLNGAPCLVLDAELDAAHVGRRRLRETLPGWNGRPVTAVVCSPSAGGVREQERWGIGRVYNARAVGNRLACEVWVDVRAARRKWRGAPALGELVNGRSDVWAAAVYRDGAKPDHVVLFRGRPKAVYAAGGIKVAKRYTTGELREALDALFDDMGGLEGFKSAISNLLEILERKRADEDLADNVRRYDRPAVLMQQERGEYDPRGYLARMADGGSEDE